MTSLWDAPPPGYPPASSPHENTPSTNARYCCGGKSYGGSATPHRTAPAAARGNGTHRTGSPGSLREASTDRLVAPMYFTQPRSIHRPHRFRPSRSKLVGKYCPYRQTDRLPSALHIELVREDTKQCASLATSVAGRTGNDAGATRKRPFQRPEMILIAARSIHCTNHNTP